MASTTTPARPAGAPDPEGEIAGTGRPELVASARTAGRAALASGRWLADAVLDIAPRLPVRGGPALSAHHDGLTGDRLARSVVAAAGRVSAGLGATAGGVITAQELSVGGLVLVPFELAALTALVVATEVKLVAELHHVAGRSLPGGPRRRTEGAVVSWMSGRAAPPGAVMAARARPPCVSGWPSAAGSACAGNWPRKWLICNQNVGQFPTQRLSVTPAAS